VGSIIANVAEGASLYTEAKLLNEAGIPSPGQRFRGDTARGKRGMWARGTIRDLVAQSAYSGVHRVPDGADGVRGRHRRVTAGS
jgi:hypothetical protein